MKSTAEQTEMAPAAATNETKGTKKANDGARRANVAPAKAKAVKKAASKKKAPRSARNDAREGSKTGHDPRTAEAAGRRYSQRIAEDDRLAAAFPARVPLGHRREEDRLDRHFDEGRRRRAQLSDPAR
jgi:hypothetical protein